MNALYLFKKDKKTRKQKNLEKPAKLKAPLLKQSCQFNPRDSARAGPHAGKFISPA